MAVLSLLLIVAVVDVGAQKTPKLAALILHRG
jgi:hypothetical protein